MKKLLIAITVIIVLAAIGVGVWAIWLQNQSTGDSSNNEQQTNQTDTEPQEVTKPLTFYYIAIGDGGKTGSMIACEDSLVSQTIEPVTTDNPVKATLERLLANKDQFIGQSGLYNALYRSNLVFESSTISDDTVTVNLAGSLKLGGECDNPRVQAQLEQTAKTAAGVANVAINLNGKPLADALSLQ